MNKLRNFGLLVAAGALAFTCNPIISLPANAAEPNGGAPGQSTTPTSNAGAVTADSASPVSNQSDMTGKEKSGEDKDKSANKDKSKSGDKDKSKYDSKDKDKTGDKDQNQSGKKAKDKKSADTAGAKDPVDKFGRKKSECQKGWDEAHQMCNDPVGSLPKVTGQDRADITNLADNQKVEVYNPYYLRRSEHDELVGKLATENNVTEDKVAITEGQDKVTVDGKEGKVTENIKYRYRDYVRNGNAASNPTYAKPELPWFYNSSADVTTQPIHDSFDNNNGIYVFRGDKGGAARMTMKLENNPPKTVGGVQNSTQTVQGTPVMGNNTSYVQLEDSHPKVDVTETYCAEGETVCSGTISSVNSGLGMGMGIKNYVGTIPAVGAQHPRFYDMKVEPLGTDGVRLNAGLGRHQLTFTIYRKDVSGPTDNGGDDTDVRKGRVNVWVLPKKEQYEPKVDKTKNSKEPGKQLELDSIPGSEISSGDIYNALRGIVKFDKAKSAHDMKKNNGTASYKPGCKVGGKENCYVFKNKLINQPIPDGTKFTFLRDDPKDGEVLPEGVQRVLVKTRYNDNQTTAAYIQDNLDGSSVDYFHIYVKVRNAVPVVKPPLVPVSSVNSPTPQDKKKIEDAIKKVNPKSGLKIEVKDDGSVVVTPPQGGTPTTWNPGEVTFQVNDPEITLVKDRNKLTSEEQNKVKDKVAAANDGTGSTTTVQSSDVTVAANGDTTFNVSKGSTSTGVQIPQKYTVVQLPELTRVEDLDNLTPKEKERVKQTILKANTDETGKPNLDLKPGTDIEVSNKGVATFTLANGKTVTINRPQTIAKLYAPQLTLVRDRNALTSAEKDKVKQAIKDANAIGKQSALDNDKEITVNNKGEAITPVITEEHGNNGNVYKYKQPETVFQYPELTLVDNENNLTPQERQKVKNAIRKANPNIEELTDDKITVDSNGRVTINIPIGNNGSQTITLNPEDTVVKLNPPEITTVGDRNDLEEDEKKQVVEKIKKANKDLFDKLDELNKKVDNEAQKKKIRIAVYNNGDTTVIMPSGASYTFPQKQTVKDNHDPDPDEVTEVDGNDMNPPVPTLVEDVNNLTPGEKDLVKKAIENANPDLKGSIDKIVVDPNGKTTVTLKGQDKPVVFPPSQTVKEKNPTRFDSDGGDFTPSTGGGWPSGGFGGGYIPSTPSSPELTVNPPAITGVGDLSKLTPGEKDKIIEKIIKANPDLKLDKSKIKIGDDGTTEITLPDGKKVTFGPKQTVNTNPQQPGTPQQPQPNPQPAPQQPPTVKNPLLTGVKDPNQLTPQEKQKVIDKIKSANPHLGLTDDKIVIGNDGYVTVTLPDGTVVRIPLSKTVVKIADSPQSKVKNPKLTQVANVKHLTEAEKQRVREAIKAANPNLGLSDIQLQIGNDGEALVLLPDGNAVVLPPKQTIYGKGLANTGVGVVPVIGTAAVLAAVGAYLTLRSRRRQRATANNAA